MNNIHDIINAIANLDASTLDPTELHMLNSVVRALNSGSRSSRTNERKANFRIGQRVRFGRPNGRQYYGEVAKINKTTLTVKGDDGRGWRVHPNLAHAA